MIVTVTLNPAIDHSVFLGGLRLGSVNRAHRELELAGGKGVNVARMLADEGQTVTATGFLGQENERIFTDLFVQRGITDAFIRLPGKTRTGIKLLDTTLGETTDINFPGLCPDAAAIDRLAERLRQLLRPGCWCVFAGSLPVGVALEQWRTLLLVAAAQGARIAVDTTGEALAVAVETGVVSLIKPNEHELAELCSLLRQRAGGGGARLANGAANALAPAIAASASLPQIAQAACAAAAGLVTGADAGGADCASSDGSASSIGSAANGDSVTASGGNVVNSGSATASDGSAANDGSSATASSGDAAVAGVGSVLVSLGEQGALYLNRRAGVFYVTPLVLEASSTVGAGDSLLAGFLAGLGGNQEPTAETVTSALQLGAAFAAWTLTHADRQPAERIALTALAEQTRVSRIA